MTAFTILSCIFTYATKPFLMVLLKSFQSLDRLPDMALHHLVGLCEALFQTDHPLSQFQLVFPLMAAVNGLPSPDSQLRRRMDRPVTF